VAATEALNHSAREVFVVDDDVAFRRILSHALSVANYPAVGFPDGEAFLTVARSRTPACILLDVNMPELSGLDVLKALPAKQYPAPILMISGVGNVAMAVDAIKGGAIGFVEKSLRGREIVLRVEQAIAEFNREPASSGFHFPGREPLSRRESALLEQLISGASNKEAARRLGISPRTVEFHRANTMRKLDAKNAADLIWMGLAAKSSI
jgi:FixJ family two-component response regulator